MAVKNLIGPFEFVFGRVPPFQTFSMGSLPDTNRFITEKSSEEHNAGTERFLKWQNSVKNTNNYTHKLMWRCRWRCEKGGNWSLLNPTQCYKPNLPVTLTLEIQTFSHINTVVLKNPNKILFFALHFFLYVCFICSHGGHSQESYLCFVFAVDVCLWKDVSVCIKQEGRSLRVPESPEVEGLLLVCVRAQQLAAATSRPF